MIFRTSRPFCEDDEQIRHKNVKFEQVKFRLGGMDLCPGEDGAISRSLGWMRRRGKFAAAKRIRNMWFPVFRRGNIVTSSRRRTCIRKGISTIRFSPRWIITSPRRYCDYGLPYLIFERNINRRLETTQRSFSERRNEFRDIGNTEDWRTRNNSIWKNSSSVSQCLILFPFPWICNEILFAFH